MAKPHQSVVSIDINDPQSLILINPQTLPVIYSEHVHHSSSIDQIPLSKDQLQSKQAPATYNALVLSGGTIKPKSTSATPTSMTSIHEFPPSSHQQTLKFHKQRHTLVVRDGLEHLPKYQKPSSNQYFIQSDGQSTRRRISSCHERESPALSDLITFVDSMQRNEELTSHKLIRKNSCNCLKCGDRTSKQKRIDMLLPKYKPKQIVKSMLRRAFQKSISEINKMNRFFKDKLSSSAPKPPPLIIPNRFQRNDSTNKSRSLIKNPSRILIQSRKSVNYDPVTLAAMLDSSSSHRKLIKRQNSSSSLEQPPYRRNPSQKAAFPSPKQQQQQQQLPQQQSQSKAFLAQFNMNMKILGTSTPTEIINIDDKTDSIDENRNKRSNSRIVKKPYQPKDQAIISTSPRQKLMVMDASPMLLSPLPKSQEQSNNIFSVDEFKQATKMQNVNSDFVISLHNHIMNSRADSNNQNSSNLSKDRLKLDSSATKQNKKKNIVILEDDGELIPAGPSSSSNSSTQKLNGRQMPTTLSKLTMIQYSRHLPRFPQRFLTPLQHLRLQSTIETSQQQPALTLNKSLMMANKKGHTKSMPRITLDAIPSPQYSLNMLPSQQPLGDKQIIPPKKTPSKREETSEMIFSVYKPIDFANKHYYLRGSNKNNHGLATKKLCTQPLLTYDHESTRVFPKRQNDTSFSILKNPSGSHMKSKSIRNFSQEDGMENKSSIMQSPFKHKETLPFRKPV